MVIESLDHVNIRTSNLDALVRFYSKAFGMEANERIGSRTRVFWLGKTGQAMLHIVEAAATDRVEKPQIEHFAFRARGLAKFVERLEGLGIAHNVRAMQDLCLLQVNLHDPDGNRVHVDFPLAEYTSEVPPIKVNLR
jgi:catechol 2,3-dioxygenase-like lactoylglutathione lyase family enzyme